MQAWGIDSVQAILLALQMIGADIYTSSYHKSGHLMFEEAGQGYGFPVPESAGWQRPNLRSVVASPLDARIA